MICHLYFFSGTGNAAHSARMIAEALQTRGHRVSMVSMEDDAQQPTAGCDLLVLIYPTYAWRPPALVSRFIGRLPKGGNTEAAILTVDGGAAMGSIHAAERLLARRGYRTAIKMATHYPHNWVEMLEPPKGQSREQGIATGIEGTERFIATLTSLDEPSPTVPRGARGAEATLNVVGLLFGLVGRRFLGKLFIADDDCTACGLCVRGCPVKAITMGTGNRPRWKSNCESCNRCINLCPTRAINTSIFRGIFLGVANIGLMILGLRVWQPLAARIWASIPGVPFPLRDLAGIIAVAVCFLGSTILTLTAVDGLVLRPILALPPLRHLAQRSFTKGFTRYRFPKDEG